jgi:HlyD family secretion protein
VTIIVIGYFLLSGKEAERDIVRVVRGSVNQEVSITGKTQAVNDVTLGFERGGKIAFVNKDVGENVSAGETLVALESSELSAQLAQAEASRDAAQAKLDEVKRGARPEDIRVKRTELAKAKQDLENDYGSVMDVINAAYVDADDAVRKQIDDLFTNDELPNVQLSFTISDSQKEIDAENQRSQASLALDMWKTSIKNITSTNPASLDEALGSAVKQLTIIRDFLSTLMDTALSATSLSATTLNTYRASITTARTNVNSALTDVNSQIQTIASQKFAVEKISDELNLKLAGNDPQEIAAQEATVKQAEANVALVRAQLAKTVIRSPFSGVVTMQDAKVGEIVPANTSVVSVVSKTKLEIEANLPEADMAKVNIGNSATVTFDAFGDELRFTSHVVAIDPAATVIEGIPTYKTTFSLEEVNPAVKPGLTANITISTQTRENVLVIPQHAIAYRGGKKVVMIVANSEGEPEEREITTGIRGMDGMIEVLSGLSEGERIIATP